MRRTLILAGLLSTVVSCGVGRQTTEELDVASQRHALVSSDAALTALGLNPANASISFGPSDEVGIDIFSASRSGFPTEGQSYLVLSSGCTGTALTPNARGDTSCTLGGLNTTAGEDLVQASLTTVVPAGGKCIFVDWKLFSEEYPEWVGSTYPEWLGTTFLDAFLIETGSSTFAVSGTTVHAPDNVAYDASGKPITVNTTGALGMSAENASGTTYDGATTMLTTRAPLSDGQTSLSLIFSVMDIGDSLYDSTLFVDNVRFSSNPCGQPVTRANQPPVVTANAGSVATKEGTAAANGGAFSDLNGDEVVLTASVGSVSKTETGTWSWSYVPPDGPKTETVVISAEDGYGGFSSVSFALNVDNVAPSITDMAAPLDPLLVGTEMTASATVQDPGVLDALSAQWIWGDGGKTPAMLESRGTGLYMATGSHSYTAPGLYTIRLDVTDKDGAVGTNELRNVVVYDPAAGFVTGGGWIASPAGAYAPNPMLTGKATFGFLAKYAEGAPTPRGSTEFQLHLADMNFHSTSYSWLVVGGARAIFKGSGSFGGEGDYAFMLTAIDGEQPGGGGMDKFRIKIWDEATGNTIYDNRVGAADGAPPTTLLGGGAIVIHH